MNNSLKLPKSASNFYINLIAVAFSFTFLFLVREFKFFKAETATQIAIAIYGTFVLFYEIIFAKTYNNPSSGINIFEPRARTLSGPLLRTIGFSATIGFVFLLYWLFKEYQGSFYHPYWRILKLIAPSCLVAILFYFYWVDAYQKEEMDIYKKIGETLIFWKPLSLLEVRKHIFGWIIKGFFMPLMYIYAIDQVQYLLTGKVDFNSFISVYNLLWHLLFGIDVLIVSIGYLLAVQSLDTHIRSPQPLALGWLVALICYQPFWSVISAGYLNYNDNLMWDVWLVNYPTLKIMWGCAILALILIYCLSTVSFGLRFSNLTNRGIITGGPYRWTKHPAYISKNISWWLVSIPFITTADDYSNVRNCLLLLVVNFIYYLRAKTEESHLQEELAYREYSAYIAKNGIFSKMSNLFKLNRSPEQ